jgi:protein TonB
MTIPDETGTHDPPERPAYRVPIGMPLRDEGRRQGIIVSILVHGAIILLLLFPIVLARTNIIPIQQGAGGAGPSGGGGGGRGGAQPHERVQFIVPTTASPSAVAPVPVSIPVPATVATPIPPLPAATPAVKPPEQAAAPVPVTTIAGAGAGPGSGNDGTAGNGPGSGGGVGSGIGPGRGSGVGPGTGGGTQKNFPPTLIDMFLPPFPVPNSVKGSSLTAEFDVDSTGRVLDVKFSETRDGDYNRRLMSVLRAMKFRPGHSPDGAPLRMKAQVGYDFGR